MVWRLKSVASAADAELVSRAALGDASAIGELYDQNAPVLMGVAVRILGNRSDAEDVVHDAFVTLPERGKHYSVERGTVGAWLIVLVRNLCIDRLRRRSVAAAARPMVAELERSEGPDPEASAVLTSAHYRVRAALASLPDAQRTTIEAAFFEGLTYAQIAERDGVPVGTIKSRCARAISALREAIDADEIAPEPLRERR
jgi:RNA polymerase sigma-70 factor, ECF subfamily